MEGSSCNLAVTLVLVLGCVHLGQAQTRGGREDFGTLSDFVLVENGLYMGDFRRGVPHGHGTLIYFTNDPKGRYNYTGDWERGKRHGNGKTMFRNGNIYEGGYDQDKENGRGKIIYSNGDIFTGFFSSGLREGSGKLVLSNGDKREGEWRHDKLTGFVFYNSANETNIERWHDGRRRGDDAKERDRGAIEQKGQEEEQDSTESPPPMLGMSPGNFTRDAIRNSLNMSFANVVVVDEGEDNKSESSALATMVYREQRTLLKRIYDDVT